jgi:hypothetical protein
MGEDDGAKALVPRLKLVRTGARMQLFDWRHIREKIRKGEMTFQNWIGLAVLILLWPVLFLLYWIWRPLEWALEASDRRSARRQRAGFETLFAREFPGQTIAEVVAASPYEISWTQGDEFVSIHDKRIVGENESPLATAGNSDRAAEWIIRRVLQDRLGR